VRCDFDVRANVVSQDRTGNTEACNAPNHSTDTCLFASFAAQRDWREHLAVGATADENLVVTTS